MRFKSQTTGNSSSKIVELINTESTMTEKNQNRLAFEKSPYLLQHAYNAVDWYPWGDEAFKKAKTENKPVFLSIGYSTCHWCHVMAHESFEDPEIAALMNDAFISIKVDREERPDIDSLYMTVCQMMTHSGGWPLTIIMTPDKEPFFAGTYFPRNTRFGRTGMSDLIPQIKQIWENRKVEVLSAASEITSALKQSTIPSQGEKPAETVLHTAFEELHNRFDRQYGGFGIAPKFPAAHNLSFLLRYWKKTGSKESLEMVEKTLQSMRYGGIYDHIGFGFHRYSTDREWLVPHFEKMLYDQALNAIAYIEAYQATGKREYAQTAEQVLDYCIRDMQSPGGGFYSAEDADSEGEEGRYYLWNSDEIKKVFDSEDAALFITVFDIKKEGNFSDESSGTIMGKNIPHLSRSIDDLAIELNIPALQLEEKIEIIREKLFAYRNRRIHPHKDDKILTDWNGLIIAALAKTGRVLENNSFISAAEKTVNFISGNMVTSEGRLLHRYRDGVAGIPAYLDDYAFLVHGLLELYESTFNVNYLKKALEFNNQMLAHFHDSQNGGFYLTADDGEELITRQKEIYDGAIPSGNSIAMLNLLRLGRITAVTDLEDRADGIARVFSENIAGQPSAHTQLLAALDFAFGPAHEIVIAGNLEKEDTRGMLSALNRSFIPGAVVIFRPDISLPEITGIAPYTKEQHSIEGKATVYVCVNYNCRLPVTDAADMLKLISGNKTD